MSGFQQSGISFEPRPLGECIDLAFRMIGRDWVRLLGLMALCALPACLITAVVAQFSEWGWLAALLSTAVASVWLGGALVAHATSALFAQPCPWRRLCWMGWWQIAPTLVWKSLLRLPVLMFSPVILPSLWLLIATGFRTENRILAQFRERHHEHSTKALIRSEFSDFLVRASLLALFGGLLWLVWLTTFDAAFTLLFGVSPVFGTISGGAADPWGFGDPFQILWNMGEVAATDPIVLMCFVANSLLVYAFIRLAWFFIYMDLRVRRDCWDLELAFAEELRLAEAIQ